MKFTERPTFENQLIRARQLLKEQGLNALYSPHAATGKLCKCGDCFCCAALIVWNESKAIAWEHNKIIQRRLHP